MFVPYLPAWSLVSTHVTRHLGSSRLEWPESYVRTGYLVLYSQLGLAMPVPSTQYCSRAIAAVLRLDSGRCWLTAHGSRLRAQGSDSQGLKSDCGPYSAPPYSTGRGPVSALLCSRNEHETASSYGGGADRSPLLRAGGRTTSNIRKEGPRAIDVDVDLDLSHSVSL